MTAPKHTPTPWGHGSRLLDITSGMRTIASIRCASEHPAIEECAHEDAALIIRAVNYHDRLVETLSRLLREIDYCADDGTFSAEHVCGNAAVQAARALLDEVK